ncbi:MAG: thymidine phosphorylase family protein [Caulobacteraceae bacterium]|nr:thymidine phosphorylase family protein [Caulobacteraceae bacterium]
MRLRRLPLDTLRQNVAFIARDCPLFRPERFAGFGKVEVRAADGRALIASIDIVDDPVMVGPAQLGLPEPAFRRLGAAEGAEVTLTPVRPPASFRHVRRKVAGEVLDEAALGEIVRDLVGHRYSDMEVAAFLVACASALGPEELLALTRAMIDSGETLRWNRAPIADKHCVGGIPGNRTSLVVAPIVIAHGLTIPKTSSRAITSPAGTADTMELLARVDLGPDAMREVVERVGGCIVWGGHVNLAPADDVLISVERPLGLDTPEQMVASILAKKVAAGSTHLLIDLPVGPTAKVRGAAEAARLRKLFEFVGRRVGLQVQIDLTDGSQPVGRGVGPELEVRDVLAVLEGRPEAPESLRARCLRLAGQVLEFDPALAGGKGEARARDLLDGGDARRALDRLIEAQGPSPLTRRLGGIVDEVAAPRSGVVAAVDCFRIARIARMAGAPVDPGAGVEMLRRIGDPVSAGEPLFRIYASEEADFRFAAALAAEDSGVRLAGEVAP